IKFVRTVTHHSGTDFDHKSAGIHQQCAVVDGAVVHFCRCAPNRRGVLFILCIFLLLNHAARRVGGLPPPPRETQAWRGPPPRGLVLVAAFLAASESSLNRVPCSRF